MTTSQPPVRHDLPYPEPSPRSQPASADPAQIDAHGDGMTRRQFLGTAGSTVAAGALAYVGAGTWRAKPAMSAPQRQGADTRPNIILIITDQERYPRHWPDGWVEENLPGHVRLAANGMTFTRHFCSATMCSPSRSTLFTGMHPAQHGVIHTLTEGGSFSTQEPTLPAGIQTMGTMLGSTGYNVVLKGKWHMTKGDDGGDPTAEQVAAYGFNGWVPTSVANDTKVSNFGGGCANLDSATTGEATDFLAGQSGAGTTDDPFCLIVGLGNPHDVLSYPNTWDEVEDSGCDNYAGFDLEQGISLPATTYENLGSKPRCQRQARDIMNLKLGTIVTPEEAGNYANFYAGLVKEVDQYIDMILDAIPEEIRANTIVVYTSDHGEMGMSHSTLRQKAFQVYEETVNVPMIVYNPVLFPAPQETDAYTALIDLMPTFATVAQVPNREKYTFYGTDLTPLFNTPDTPVQTEILFTFDDIYAANPDGAVVNPLTGVEIPAPPKNIHAIFTQDDDGEWKYARYFDVNGEEVEEYEMYHLRNGLGVPIDPLEIDNLAHDSSPKYNEPAIVAKREDLAQRLAALEASRLQPLEGPEIFLPFIQT